MTVWEDPPPTRRRPEREVDEPVPPPPPRARRRPLATGYGPTRFEWLADPDDTARPSPVEAAGGRLLVALVVALVAVILVLGLLLR